MLMDDTLPSEVDKALLANMRKSVVQARAELKPWKFILKPKIRARSMIVNCRFKATWPCCA